MEENEFNVQELEIMYNAIGELKITLNSPLHLKLIKLREKISNKVKDLRTKTMETWPTNVNGNDIIPNVG